MTRLATVGLLGVFCYCGDAAAAPADSSINFDRMRHVFAEADSNLWTGTTGQAEAEAIDAAMGDGIKKIHRALAAKSKLYSYLDVTSNLKYSLGQKLNPDKLKYLTLLVYELLRSDLTTTYQLNPIETARYDAAAAKIETMSATMLSQHLKKVCRWLSWQGHNSIDTACEALRQVTQIGTKGSEAIAELVTALTGDTGSGSEAPSSTGAMAKWLDQLEKAAEELGDLNLDPSPMYPDRTLSVALENARDLLTTLLNGWLNTIRIIAARFTGPENLDFLIIAMKAIAFVHQAGMCSGQSVEESINSIMESLGLVGYRAERRTIVPNVTCAELPSKERQAQYNVHAAILSILWDRSCNLGDAGYNIDEDMSRVRSALSATAKQNVVYLAQTTRLESEELNTEGSGINDRLELPLFRNIEFEVQTQVERLLHTLRKGRVQVVEQHTPSTVISRDDEDTP
ncbi:MAG: hypothetical protein LBJ19_00785 [Holosporaceae bacterium]|nr:hypothetical protein [Holosporaceae bacterium]